jgi:predicted Fe-S protein YdhL (DUF1289 family)
MSSPASPCIDVCAIDPKSRLCMGCYRMLEEIAAWPQLSHAERSAIMQSLEGRRAAVGPFPIKGARIKR